MRLCSGVNANLIHHDSGSQSTAPFSYLWALKIYRLLSWRETTMFYMQQLIPVFFMAEEQELC